MPKRLNNARLSAIVFALLVLATIVAFAYAQRVKRDPLVLDKVSFVGFPVLDPKDPVHNFTPNGDCRFDRIRIRFRVTQSNRGTVQVVKPGGRVRVTPAKDQPPQPYPVLVFHRDGPQPGGRTALPGR